MNKSQELLKLYEGFIKDTKGKPKVFYHGSFFKDLRPTKDQSMYSVDDPAIASTYGPHTHKFLIKDPGALKKHIVRGKASTAYGYEVIKDNADSEQSHTPVDKWGKKGARELDAENDKRSDGFRIPLTDKIARSDKNKRKKLTLIKDMSDPDMFGPSLDVDGKDVKWRPANLAVSHDSKGRKYLGVSDSIYKETEPHIDKGIQEKPLSKEVRDKLKAIRHKQIKSK